MDDVQLPGIRRAVDFCVAYLGWVTEEKARNVSTSGSFSGRDRTMGS